MWKLSVLSLLFIILNSAADDSIADTLSAGAVDTLSQPVEGQSRHETPPSIGKYALNPLSPQQLTELYGYLSSTVPDTVSSRVAGAVYNPIEKKIVLILIGQDGQPSKMPIDTPSWLYDKIIKPKETESIGEIETVASEISGSEVGEKPVKKASQQDGRTYFIINNTIKATTIYPGALAMALPNTDGRIITGVALLTFGGALYGSYALTSNMPMGYGKVAIMNFGGEVGVYYPNLLSMMLADQGYENTARHISSWGSMIGFPLGITAASFTHFVENHEYGNAAIMRHFARVGLVYGFTIPLLWAFDHDFRNYITTSSALSMCLIPAGFYVGKTIVGDRCFSAGRSGLVVITGIMGAITGAVIPSWFESETPELYVAMGLAGSAAGTVFGFLFHKPHEYKLWQGVFMGVSAAVGAGVGASIPFLAKATDSRPYTILGVAGGWSGLIIGELLSKALFETSSRDVRASTDNIEFPIMWEWPSIAYAAFNKKSGNTFCKPMRADIVRISF